MAASPTGDIHAGRDSGMATAEMAAALPVLMLLVLTAVYAVQVAGMRVRCLDAAREVARAAARSDPRAAAVGRAVLPGASVAVRRSSSTVSAVVTVRLHPLGGGLPAVTITEQVTAATEPSLDGQTIPAASRARQNHSGAGPAP
jgi:Flp pilus assembly protein TadG